MNVVFRADASLQIGTGHVMRCLTLADALAARGAECQFISRAHPGNLIEFVRSRGYIVHALPESPAGIEADPTGDQAQSVAHGHWLGVTQAQDAEACAPILADLRPDWLIMDHYALDARWERALKSYYRRLMVIDDLADRPHESDLLLDQTYSRKTEDYRAWVPASCRLLCGSQYALLRPEFAALRPYSLQRRNEPQLRQLLITMGGVDKDNATGQVLEALRACALPVGCRITVVIGATAPWLSEVERLAQNMPWPTQVKVGVRDMAQLMADSDLAIGAAGATSWERCCLGLPTIMLVLADNQRTIAQALHDSGSAQLVDSKKIENQLLISLQLIDFRRLSLMTKAAIAVTDGLGAERIIENLTNKAKYED